MASSSTKSDVYARYQSGSNAGRGSIAGWTPCPLCCVAVSSCDDETQHLTTNKLHVYIPSDQAVINTLSNIKQSKSVKLFSHGRGLASHLHAVHTPWNPGKAELKRRTAARKRLENEQRRLHATSTDSDNPDRAERPKKRLKLNNSDDDKIPLKWDPSSEEIDEWNARVVQIVTLVEVQSNKTKYKDELVTGTNIETNNNPSSHGQVGTDRSGNICKSYRESLPPFLAAAADGDIDDLVKCINDHDKKSNMNTPENKVGHIKSLISCLDRNGSSAEHWASGGGHVECLKYLLELSDMVKDSEQQTNNEDVRSSKSDKSTSSDGKKIRRRRDGKTSLHYAARNGHISCIDLIMTRSDAPSIDTASGDGTTPLHLACYGGHVSTVRHLIEKYKANVHAVNEWSCGAAHWAAMSLGNAGMDTVIELCNYLKEDCSVDFTSKQKQGHTPLHKAAAKKNQVVIEWLAGKSMNCNDDNCWFSENDMMLMGQPDNGGNKPSDIWLSVGGDAAFAQWMKDNCGW